MTEVTANVLNVKVTIETLSAGDSDTGPSVLRVSGLTAGHRVYWSLLLTVHS